MQSRTIERLLSLLEQFVHSESAGGLAVASPVAFAWANSPWVLVGLEIEREVFVGWLSTLRDSVPEGAAALGLLGRRASPGAG